MEQSGKLEQVISYLSHITDATEGSNFSHHLFDRYSVELLIEKAAHKSLLVHYNVSGKQPEAAKADFESLKSR